MLKGKLNNIICIRFRIVYKVNLPFVGKRTVLFIHLYICLLLLNSIGAGSVMVSVLSSSVVDRGFIGSVIVSVLSSSVVDRGFIGSVIVSVLSSSVVDRGFISSVMLACSPRVR